MFSIIASLISQESPWKIVSVRGCLAHIDLKACPMRDCLKCFDWCVEMQLESEQQHSLVWIPGLWSRKSFLVMKHACIHSALDCGCHVTSCLLFLSVWVSCSYGLKRTLLPKLLLLGVFYPSNRNKTKTHIGWHHTFMCGCHYMFTVLFHMRIAHTETPPI